MILAPRLALVAVLAAPPIPIPVMAPGLSGVAL